MLSDGVGTFLAQREEAGEELAIRHWVGDRDVH
jgi:hypothetical protein